MRSLRETIVARWRELSTPGALKELARELDLPLAVVWNNYARLEEAAASRATQNQAQIRPF